MYAGGVTVVHDRHVLREPLDEADLPLRQRRAAGGHDIGDTELVHRKHIQIPFHEIALVLARHLVLGEPDPVQRPVLYIDVRLLGVHVLGVGLAFLLGSQRPGSEGNDPSAHGMDREDHAVVEPVAQPVVRIVGGAQSRLKEILVLVAGGLRGVRQRMTAGRSPAKPVFLDRRILQTSGVEIFKAHGPPLPGAKLLLEEIAGIFRDKQKALVPLTVRYVFRSLLFLNHFDVVFLGEVPQRLDVGQVLVVHDEPYGGSSLVAAEAVVLSLRRDDVE